MFCGLLLCMVSFSVGSSLLSVLLVRTVAPAVGLFIVASFVIRFPLVHRARALSASKYLYLFIFGSYHFHDVVLICFYRRTCC